MDNCILDTVFWIVQIVVEMFNHQNTEIFPCSWANKEDTNNHPSWNGCEWVCIWWLSGNANKEVDQNQKGCNQKSHSTRNNIWWYYKTNLKQQNDVLKFFQFPKDAYSLLLLTFLLHLSSNSHVMQTINIQTYPWYDHQ